MPADCDEVKRAAHECIYGQTHRAAVEYELLYSDIALMPITMNDGTIQSQPFDDFLVRDVINNSVAGLSIKRFSDTGRASEWVGCDLATVKAAITAIKAGQDRISTGSAPVAAPAKKKIVLRKEQAENVEKTINIFKSYDSMLWDCKMRYGKTVTAYEVIRRMNEKGLFKKVIVITHRPAVEDGWGEDHDLIFAGTNHRFIDKTNGRDEYNGALDAENDRQLRKAVDSGDSFIYFASIQDLRGSSRVGGRFNKNNFVFDLDWDLLIIDEAHEGTQTELGDAVITAIKKPNTKVLSLSGTPYNIIGDYQEDNKYTWTYVDEQKAKKEWEIEHPDEKNPYEELPTMNIYTFDITEQIPESYCYVTEDSAFNFREFFRTWTGDKDKDYRDIPEGKRIGDFVHEDDVYNFLSLISKEDPNSNYPFATEEFRDMFRHTFWLVPGVASARALSAMLKKHPRFNDYEIVNIAGDGDEERPYDEALGLVKSAIKTYPKTISISCGKLTTGVTVREWTGVMMLSGSSSTSASGYMQAIFRVQSPGCIDGKQKKNCYVFDFAPDRTLKVIAEVHSLRHNRGQGGDEKAKQVLGEFLNFCPVIAIEGTAMRTYDVPEMMRQIKRISVEAAINSGFDDDTIYKSDAGLVVDKFDAEILKKLSDVVVPKGKSKKQNEVNINDTGMTNEERKTAERAAKKKKKDLTPEEKEALEKLKKQKEEQKKMFNLLRAVSIRLPLLFYGADADITEIIHLKDFVTLVDDESWAEFMPTGLRKELFLDILRYYDEDVVTGAGLRIRKLAKAADELPPTFRAKRIVEILSRFKNPDKETVLTPWRVVNMHLGDMLGGYNFYNEAYTKEIDEPRLIEQDSITADILLNEDAKILEMNSKSGLYPLYMTYSIYMMYVDEDERKLPLEKAQEIWFRALEKNIFVLCKTKMARTITIRTLAGYSGKPVNAICLPKLIEERMKDIPRLANKLRNPATWKKEGEEKMRFDAVVGNPPYQLEGGSGGNNDAPIYQSFAMLSKELDPAYSSLIMPSRWFAAGRENLLGPFRKYMLTNKQLQKMVAYTDSSDLFPTVEIKGGICYYLINKGYSGNCEYTLVKEGQRETISRDLGELEILIRDPMFAQIVAKVMSHKAQETEFVDSIISNDTPFGISSNPKTSKKNPMAVYGDSTPEHCTYLYHIENNARKVEFVKASDIVKNADDIKYDKVFVPGGYGAGETWPHQILGIPEIAPKNSVCSQSYLYAKFSSEKRARNFVTYYKTKFFRALVASIKITQSAPSKVYQFVPLEDLENVWTDEALYKKYDLSEAEISFIEKMIKPMGDGSEIAEYLKVSYNDLVDRLLQKYGKAKYNYFKDTGCTVKNPAVSRTDEGLYCHHIDEDKAIMLSNDKFAAQNPFEYQRKDRLVYCNLLEHLLLHVKIAEEPRNPDANENELPGIGGAINFIVRQLNDIYGGKESAEEWRKKVAEQVIDQFDDYIAVLRHLWDVVEANPLYKAIITKEDLAKGCDGKIVPIVWDALNE